YPGHRGSQVLRVLREVALARNGRGDRHVRGLAWTQPVAQGIEQLTLGEPADTRRVVRRQVAGVRLERPDEERSLGRPEPRQPSLRRRIAEASMAVGAAAGEQYLSPPRDLFCQW